MGLRLPCQAPQFRDDLAFFQVELFGIAAVWPETRDALRKVQKCGSPAMTHMTHMTHNPYIMPYMHARTRARRGII